MEVGMRKYSDVLRKFYRSDRWKKARQIKIASANGLCERCGAVGTEVHHIVHLTPENVGDPNISLNQDNLMLLCNKCHNEVHGRFEGKSKYTFDEEGNLIPRNK